MGAEHSYTCLVEDVVEVYTNTVVVSGTTITGGHLIASDTAVVKVQDAMFFTSDPVTSTVEGQAYEHQVVTYFARRAPVVTITAPTLPDWLNLVDNGDGTALLSGTPDQAGQSDVELMAQDVNGLIDLLAFTIIVEPAGAPTLKDIYLPLLVRGGNELPGPR